MVLMRLPLTPPQNDGIFEDIGKIIIELANHLQGAIAIRKSEKESGEKEWEILIGDIDGEQIGKESYPYGAVCEAWEWYQKKNGATPESE